MANKYKYRSEGDVRGQGKNEPVPDPKRAMPKVDLPRVPMDEARGEVRELLKNRDSMLISGQTGSGKTTRTPLYILEDFPEVRTAVTQPRVLAATSTSEFMANSLGEQVGGRIGCQIRFENKTSAETRSTLMTDGILLRKLHNDPLLLEYDVVMVDEAHERSLNIDLLLGLLKRAQQARKENGKPDLKIVVMSATIEKEKFATYFNEAPIVEVPGRMFDVEVQFDERAAEQNYNYTTAAAERVRSIAQAGLPGDVLIFMPGRGEIEATIEAIRKLNIGGLNVMPLYGEMNSDEQRKIFGKSQQRKVIVATNIAETSITIDGVRHVIDSGLIKQTNFDERTGIQSLAAVPHARGGCDQRKGRAGRTAPGTCYRLYTQESFISRKPHQVPEILRSNLDHVILTMKKNGIDDVRNFDLIDPLDGNKIEAGVRLLKMFGALDDTERLTELGDAMAELPVSPELARMLLEARKFDCTGSITTLVAMASEKNIFERPRDSIEQQEAQAAHAQFKKCGSDYVAMLEVWKQWTAAGFSDKWAKQRYLHLKNLNNIRKVRDQLLRDVKRQGLSAVDGDNVTSEAIQKCVVAGQLHHLYEGNGSGNYRAVGSGIGNEVVISRDSSLASGYYIDSEGKRVNSRFMVAGDVMKTEIKKTDRYGNPKTFEMTFANRCQAVNPEWLPEIAPQMLSELQRSAMYDVATDTVLEKVDYAFKGTYKHLVSTKEIVQDEEMVRTEFARALAEGRVDLPCVKYNEEVLEKLKNLYVRSGGLSEVPQLAQYYKERLGGAKSRAEAIYIDEHLRLKMTDYCGIDMLTKIERELPERIVVKGRELTVGYTYRAAEPEAYYADNRVEEFNAKVRIPVDLLFDLQLSDIPKIGSAGRPVIIFSSGESYNETQNVDLESLKASVDKHRLEHIWNYEFIKPADILVVPTDLKQLSSPTELGIKPVVYAQDYQGKDVVAYPGYRIGQKYNALLGIYDNYYKIVYYFNETEATAGTKQALDSRTEEIAKELRRQTREQFLVPALLRYEKMRSMMMTFNQDRTLYGLTDEEFGRLYNGWYSLESNLRSSDADPQTAMAMMDEIERATTTGRVEVERRRTLLEAVKNEMTELAERMNKLTFQTYRHYGLTIERYREIEEKWLAANEAIKLSRNSYFRPDPDLARRLMQEAKTLIPNELGELSPEQEKLLDLLFGPSDYVQMVQVRGGKITGVGVPTEPKNMRAVGKTMAKRGGGEDYLVQGGNLISLYTASSNGRQFKLTDGDYVLEDGGNIAIKVEPAPAMLGGYKALQLINSEHFQGNPYLDPRKNMDSGRVTAGASSYALTGSSSSGFGGNNPFAGALKTVKQAVADRNFTGEPLPTRPGLEKAASSSRLELPEPLVTELKQPEIVKSVTEAQRAPVEKELLTDNARNELMNALQAARMLLDDVRAVPEPTDKQTTNAAKISKTRQAAAERKADLNQLSRELGNMEDSEKAAGLVNAVRRSAEKVAKDMAFLRNERQDWPRQFELLLASLTAIAETYGETITDEHLKKLIPLAKRKGSIDDIAESELEAIFS